MWVLRKIPVDETTWDKISPWKGCLYVDQDNNKAWYATGLAKLTRFASPEEAEDCARVIRAWPSFSGSEIQVAVYEEIFQEPLPIPTTRSITTVKDTTNVNIPDWNWNDEEVPF